VFAAPDLGGSLPFALTFQLAMHGPSLNSQGCRHASPTMRKGIEASPRTRQVRETLFHLCISSDGLGLGRGGLDPSSSSQGGLSDARGINSCLFIFNAGGYSQLPRR